MGGQGSSEEFPPSKRPHALMCGKIHDAEFSEWPHAEIVAATESLMPSIPRREVALKKAS
jgi:hypothetical protein